MGKVTVCRKDDQKLNSWSIHMHVAALGTMAQRMVYQHQSQHRFGNWRCSNPDTRIVAAMGFQ